MLTRKEFVTTVVEGLKLNPKAVLRGHGMRSTTLNQIVGREDVLAKIASIAFSTVYAPKGFKALMKQDNFKIFAYQNFNMLNGRARQDAEVFASGLSEADQAEFDTNENCLTIAMLPDTDDAGTEENIKLGKSATLKFNSSVTKEYKMPEASYIVVMFGDSAIRKAEVAKAEAKAEVNEAKVERTKSPQKIKAKLVRNAKAKKTKLNKSNFKLNNKAEIERRALGEFSRYGKELGAGANASPAQITRAEREFNRRTTAGAGAIKAARIDELQREINTIGMKNRTLRAQAKIAATPKMRADLLFAVRKNETRIAALKNSISVYDDVSVKSITKRQAELNKIEAKIKANLEAGDTITAATQKAIASLDLPAQQKRQIAQEVIEEVANGQQVSNAVQHVLEQRIQEAPMQQLPAQSPMPVQTPQVPPVVAKKTRTRRNKNDEFFIDQNVRVDVMGDDFVNAPFSEEEVEMSDLPFFSRTKKKLSDLLSGL